MDFIWISLSLAPNPNLFALSVGTWDLLQPQRCFCEQTSHLRVGSGTRVWQTHPRPPGHPSWLSPFAHELSSSGKEEWGPWQDFSRFGVTATEHSGHWATYGVCLLVLAVRTSSARSPRVCCLCPGCCSKSFWSTSIKFSVPLSPEFRGLVGSPSQQHPRWITLQLP